MQLLLLIQFRIGLYDETILPRPSVSSLFRSLQAFHEATSSLREMNFSGTRDKTRAEGGCNDNDKADRNSQLLHVSRSDRLSNLSTISSFYCTLFFPTSGTLSFSKLRSPEAFGGKNKSIARIGKKRGCKVYTRWKSVTTMR